MVFATTRSRCSNWIALVLVLGNGRRSCAPEWNGFKVVLRRLYRGLIRLCLFSCGSSSLSAITCLLGSGLPFIVATTISKQGRHFGTEFQGWTLLRWRGTLCNSRRGFLVLMRMFGILSITKRRSSPCISTMIRRWSRMRVTR